MSKLESAWYKGATWLYLLLPVSWLFQFVAGIRKKRLLAQQQPLSKPVPVIVIGNISVGGTGKTPLIMTLTRKLKKAGYKPGIVSRGYGGRAESYPLAVAENSRVEEAGDEPALLAHTTECPVVVDPDRRRGCEYLIEKFPVDVVLSDDGLQHYRLPRDIEIVVVDGERLFGNGLSLPAGPLREPVSRLATADLIVVNGEPAQALPELADAFVMHVKPRFLVNMASGERRPFSGAPFKMGDRVQAVAGLGNPQRFFNLLQTLPYSVTEFPFPDHHPFTERDFIARGISLSHPIVMTEKDGIKCRDFANKNFWVVRADIELPETFLPSLTALLNK